MHRSQRANEQVDPGAASKGQVSLEQALAQVEKRVLAKTIRRQKVSHWPEQLASWYVIVPALPAPMRYRIVDDKITFHPNLEFSLQKQIKDMRAGFLPVFNLRFHENLHLTHENNSK